MRFFAEFILERSEGLRMTRDRCSILDACNLSEEPAVKPQAKYKRDCFASLAMTARKRSQ